MPSFTSTYLNFFFPALRMAKGLSVAAAVAGGASAIGAIGSAVSASNAADAQASAAANANAPWSAAQPFISGEFQPAQTALNNALGMGVYSGERIAGLNPYQTQGADKAASWANSNGLATADQLFNTGRGLTDAGSAYGSNAGRLFATTQTDPTQGFLSTASQYANNPYVNGMIDAANTDVQRELNSQQLPTLAVNAAGSGNTDSTRTGVAQGIMQSRAQEDMLNNASNIRGQLFNSGLNMAQTQYNTQQQQALDANQQMGSAFQLGNTALLNGQEANGNNFDQLNAAGGLYQTQQQNQDQAAYNQFQEQQTTPLNLMGQYMNVINGKWGGPAVSSVGPSVIGGALQGAVGGAMQGYGATQMLGGYGNNTPSMSALNGVGYSMPDTSSFLNGATNSYGFTTAL